MKYRAALLLLLLALPLLEMGCERKGLERSGTAFHVRTEDPRMVAAREEAKKRWPEFVAAFGKSESTGKFSVKAPLKAKTGEEEFIWIAVTGLDGANIQGLLANEPVMDLGVKFKDPVQVNQDDVYDWLYYDDAGTMIGGFQIAVIRTMQKEAGGE